jgi:hypothetical protein
VTFKLPYGYAYIINFGRTQAEEILNSVNQSVPAIDKQNKFARSKIGGGQVYDRSAG